jgi:hypothetical protein
VIEAAFYLAGTIDQYTTADVHNLVSTESD